MNKAYMSSLRLIYIKRITYTVARANALENTETIKKSQKSKKSLQKEEKKVRYY